MIFAAGMGSRLKPLTDKMPKALVPVNGKPMLEHVLLKLKAAGFFRIVINIHHFGEQILQFLESNNNFGLNIDISDERDYLMDTGGGIKHAARYLEGDEPFLVHNVDILSNVDLSVMYRHHVESNAAVTLLVSRHSSTRQLFFDKTKNLCGWRNNETGEVKPAYPYFDCSKSQGFTFGGIHVISSKIFDYMDEWTGKFSIIDLYLSICPKASIRYYTTDDLKMIDIGKPETLSEAGDWIKRISIFT